MPRNTRSAALLLMRIRPSSRTGEGRPALQHLIHLDKLASAGGRTASDVRDGSATCGGEWSFDNVAGLPLEQVGLRKERLIKSKRPVRRRGGFSRRAAVTARLDPVAPLLRPSQASLGAPVEDRYVVAAPDREGTHVRIQRLTLEVPVLLYWIAEIEFAGDPFDDLDLVPTFCRNQARTRSGCRSSSSLLFRTKAVRGGLRPLCPNSQDGTVRF
jgi:hypothetical protein